MSFFDAILDFLGLSNKHRDTSPPHSKPPSNHEPRQPQPSLEMSQPIEKVRKKLLPSERPDGIEENQEFKDALDKIKRGERLIFVTGRAGTGKSTFIRFLRSKINRNIVVVAPTGIAALNSSGQTIHSFFRFPPRPINLDEVSEVSNQILYKKIDILVIDEVSMVRADLFDAIERFMRLNGRNSDEFFGGTQVILIGDLFQLPPVLKREDEQEFLAKRYCSPFFFSAKSLHGQTISYSEMKKNYRQDDEEYLSLLNRIRIGEDVSKAIAVINSRHNARDFDQDDFQNITLTTTRKIAQAKNDEMHARISGQEYIFNAIVEGNYDIQREDLPAPFSLRVKIGSKVMFSKNDPSKRFVNGTVGVITKISNDMIQVKTAKLLIDLERQTWSNIAYEYDPDHDCIVSVILGSYQQFPILPAWAITIHKSQGKTLGKTIVNLGIEAFASGQLYVALSRVRRMQDLFLERPVRVGDAKCDSKVVAFYKHFEENPYLTFGASGN